MVVADDFLCVEGGALSLPVGGVGPARLGGGGGRVEVGAGEGAEGTVGRWTETEILRPRLQ